MKKKKGYSKELPRAMYSYFVTYDSPVGAPSFSKFARLRGFTLSELESFRVHREFERAFAECIEIRRDYLIDMAISKRADAAFTKFLLSEESCHAEVESLKVTLTVID